MGKGILPKRTMREGKGPQVQIRELNSWDFSSPPNRNSTRYLKKKKLKMKKKKSYGLMDVSSLLWMWAQSTNYEPDCSDMSLSSMNEPGVRFLNRVVGVTFLQLMKEKL